MNNNIQFAGTWFNTVRDAADHWAGMALPDVSVISEQEDACKAACDLEEYCWNEAVKSSQNNVPEGVDEDEWRAICRERLEKRILKHRSEE